MPPKKAAVASPHRFVAKRNHAQAAAPSTLRHETKQPDDDETNAVIPIQFAQAPRFSHGKSRVTNQSRQSSSPPRSGFLQALKGSRQASDIVEDAASEDEEMLDNGQEIALPTTEPDEEGEQWSNELPMSPKRCKLAESSASPYLINHGRRLTPFDPTSTASGSVAETTFSRPVFVRPASREDESKEPVPEIFSPHRRGAKFVAGGMAATAQQWVLETGQAAVQSRKGMGYLHGEVFVMRATIESDVEGDGPFTVLAKSSSGERMRLLLSGGGNGTAATRRDDLGVGTAIGVRPPMWDVELDCETWMVAVDWRIII